MRRLFGLNLLLISLISLSGCGSGVDIPMQPTVKVTGQILLDGKPVEGLDIRLIPIDNTKFKLQETPYGRTEQDGKFQLTTYNTHDGAPLGEYLVALAYPDQISDDAEADETEAAIAAAKAKKSRGGKRFPAIYQVPQKSGLKVTIEKAGELPPFDLTSQLKK